MKRFFLLAVVMVLWALPALHAVDIETGLFIGTRTVKSPDIRSVYGNGMIYYPYLGARLWKGLSIGAAYEAGYSRTGKIGLYEEATRLRVTGFEFFAAYQIDFGKISPYLKAGYGFYSYKQTIDSPYHSAAVVDARKGTWIAAGGLKAYFASSFFLAGEVRYVPLKVAPLDISVDLGGIRYSVGAGIRF